MDKTITGGCACGAIRYEVAADPMVMFNCHCRDCQKTTGGGYTPVFYAPANVFKITKYTYTNNSVRIDWLNDAGKESVTVFAEFVGNGTTMAQQENGDKPRRPFHRC